MPLSGKGVPPAAVRAWIHYRWGGWGKKLPPGAEEKEGSSSSKIVGRGLNYFSRGENAGGPKRQSDIVGSTIFSPLCNRQLLFLRVTLMSKFPSRSKDAAED